MSAASLASTILAVAPIFVVLVVVREVAALSRNNPDTSCVVLGATIPEARDRFWLADGANSCRIGCCVCDVVAGKDTIDSGAAGAVVWFTTGVFETTGGSIFATSLGGCAREFALMY